MGKTEDNWMRRYEELKAHVQVTGHFANKHTRLNTWVKYQRKRMKAGQMSPEQLRLFTELADSRSHEHTGGRRKKTAGEEG